MSYTDKHKMVLQSIMCSKCLPKPELVEVFKKLQINENQIDLYISTINSQIGRFNFSIQRCMDDQKGEIYYGLICISENRISKMATLYSAEQLEVLKAALELIITKNGRFKAKKIVKIMFNKNVKFPTIKDIYNAIEEFVKEKYFIQDHDYYYIQPRALIEFNMYFRTYYKDFIQDCVLCKQLCIRPNKCKHCEAPYHKQCANRYSEQHTGQEKCMSCNNLFELMDTSIDSVASDDLTQRCQLVSDFLNQNSTGNNMDNNDSQSIENDESDESNDSITDRAMEVEQSQEV